MKYAILSFWVLCSSLVLAHNNLFFPGDAYFSLKWKPGKVDLKKSSVMLDYYRLSKDFMACGYVGCYHLKVKGLPDKYATNLERVNGLLESKYKALAISDRYAEIGEKSHFRAFIYNKDYDFSKLGLGYKFNENWVKLQTKDAKRNHAIYDGTQSVIFDWEHSADVAGLKLTKKPKSLKGEMGIEEPVEGNAKDYSIVIVLGDFLETSQEELDLSFERNKNEEVVNTEKRKILDDYQFLVIDEKIRLFSRDYEGKIISKTLP